MEDTMANLHNVNDPPARRSSRFLFGAYACSGERRDSTFPTPMQHLPDRERLAPRAEAEHIDARSELRGVPTLAELPREALANLATLASARREPLGAVLSEQGAAVQRLELLLRGAVKVVRATQHALGKTTVVLDVARGPAILPTTSLFDGQPELASIVALRTAHLVSVDRRVVLGLAEQHPAFGRALLMHLSHIARRYVRRIDEVASGPVDDRVRHLLEDLAAQHGTAFGQRRFIAIPLRRKDIACMVNATTETVSRVLARFEREGLTRSTRDGIWLCGAASPTRSAQVQEGDSGNALASSRGAR
jgi:CRP-like cAMP-binding protein